MTESGRETAPKMDQDFDRNFRPKGALVFFAVLVALGMIIWFGIYFLMLSRV